MEAYRDFFQAQGFQVFHDVWDQDEVRFARNLVGDLIRRHRIGDEAVVLAGISISLALGKQSSEALDFYSRQLSREPYIIGNLVGLDFRFAKLFCANRIWEVAASLLECKNKDVEFHFSNITRKPAKHSPKIKFHRDSANTYFAAADKRTVRLLLPLQTMSEVNGGTEISAGSHSAEFVANGEMECPLVPPGACLAIHADVLHGGGSNLGQSERDVIVMQFGVRGAELSHRAQETLSCASRNEFSEYVHAVGNCGDMVRSDDCNRPSPYENTFGT
jgi:hypothetical protein